MSDTAPATPIPTTPTPAPGQVDIRIYRAGTQWCYAADVDGEYDSSDTLDVDDDASEEDAEAAARADYPDAQTVSVTRVADIA